MRDGWNSSIPTPEGGAAPTLHDVRVPLRKCAVQPDLLAPRSPEIHRLFLALWPDGAVREAARRAVTHLQQAHDPGGRAVNPARYHVTLQFFGDFDVLPEGLLAGVRRAMEGLKASRFVLPLERAGRFGSVGWLGPTRTPEPLDELWNALNAALAASGVRVRGHARFVPHLTVLRDLRRPLPAVAIDPIEWHVDGVVLIDSRHGRGTVAYDVVERWPLR